MQADVPAPLIGMNGQAGLNADRAGVNVAGIIDVPAVWALAVGAAGETCHGASPGGARRESCSRSAAGRLPAARPCSQRRRLARSWMRLVETWGSWHRSTLRGAL